MDKCVLSGQEIDNFGGIKDCGDNGTNGVRTNIGPVHAQAWVKYQRLIAEAKRAEEAKGTPVNKIRDGHIRKSVLKTLADKPTPIKEPIEGEQKPAEERPEQAENIIGDMPFGITAQAIEEQAATMKDELGQINAKLAEKDVGEVLREFCEKRKVKIATYLAAPTDEILRSLQEVYDFVHAREQQKISRDDILRTMKREKPELIKAISKYYDVLGTKTWGYRVFNYLCGLRG